jgi:V8-like Glu-specific endopeptidase
MSTSISPRRRLGAVAITALAAAAVACPGATSASAQPEKGAASAADAGARGAVRVTDEAWAAGRAKHGKNATAAQAIEGYWTPARMRAAKPIEESPELQAAAKRYEKKAAEESKNGTKSPSKPGPQRQVDPTETPGATTLAAYNPNLPYYSSTARTAGKVFFTMNGSNFVCSGTIVNSEGKDTVWTAGHCVHGGQGGSWAYNWSFVPAYDDDLANPRPYGTWTAFQLWTKTAWTNNSNFSEDMGVAIMNTRNGWHIVDYFGGQGIRVNAGKNVYEYAFGYPAESPFDGGNLYRCQGSTSPEWDSWFSWSQTLKISCDMTRGSSGGGWLHGYDGNWGWLNGVNSRIDRIVNPTIMLSPYFDDTAWSLYNDTRYL